MKTMKTMKTRKIKFTKASRKDARKVTVSLNELGGDVVTTFPAGTAFLIVFPHNVKVLFEVNRAGKTASTNAWPFIFAPSVGDPVFYPVVDVVFLEFSL